MTGNTIADQPPARYCSDIVREHGGREPSMEKMKGCRMGGGGHYIYGGEGNDKVVIEGHDVPVHVDGGPGRDQVLVRDGSTAGMVVSGVTSPAGTLIALALIAAVMLTLIVRFVPRR
jgi:hypothetical protein